MRSPPFRKRAGSFLRSGRKRNECNVTTPTEFRPKLTAEREEPGKEENGKVEQWGRVDRKGRRRVKGLVIIASVLLLRVRLAALLPAHSDYQ